MCGRYVLASKLEKIQIKFGVLYTGDHPEYFNPNYNIQPGQFAPVITSGSPGEIQFFRFGFIPSWSKDGRRTFNARAEGQRNASNDPDYSGGWGLKQMPQFLQAIRSQRCLIIADAYYSFKERSSRSEPHLIFYEQKKRPIALAGVYDYWKDPVSGNVVPGFAIITTYKNDLVHQIGHDRSPVIIEQRYFRKWLSLKTDLSFITSCFTPPNAAEMNGYPVSALLKHEKKNSIDLLKPTGPNIYLPRPPQYTQVSRKDIKLSGDHIIEEKAKQEHLKYLEELRKARNNF